MRSATPLARAFGSVRVRITVLAMVVFAIAAVVGSTVLVRSVRGSLEDGVRKENEVALSGLAEQVRTGADAGGGVGVSIVGSDVLVPAPTSGMFYVSNEDGDVVAKTDILDEIWGTDIDRDPNVVEVYVSALRRKIDQPFGTRTIQTVPRLGYRMVP